MTINRGAFVASQQERPDVAAAAGGIVETHASRRALAHIEDHLDPAEQVVSMAAARRNSSPGIIVLTDRRLLFLWRAPVTGRTSHDSIPLDLVTGVAVHQGLVFSEIKTQGAQSMERLREIDKKDADALAGELRALIGRRSHSAMQSNPIHDVADQLEKLAALRDRGVLTDVEFATQKAKLLG